MQEMLRFQNGSKKQSSCFFSRSQPVWWLLMISKCWHICAGANREGGKQFQFFSAFSNAEIKIGKKLRFSNKQSKRQADSQAKNGNDFGLNSIKFWLQWARKNSEKFIFYSFQYQKNGFKFSLFLPIWSGNSRGFFSQPPESFQSNQLYSWSI